MLHKDRMMLQAVIEAWGKDCQMVVACEEMSELTKEICKAYRGRPNVDNIAEEIADVQIMLEQLKLIFGCRPKVNDFERYKLDRLADRLEQEANV